MAKQDNGGSSQDRRFQRRHSAESSQPILLQEQPETQVHIVDTPKTVKKTRSSSDGLAIALFCLAGVMAIILFFAEKTPTTIVSLLLLLVGLSIYPIFHFIERKALRCTAIGVVVTASIVAGWRLWPKPKAATPTLLLPQNLKDCPPPPADAKNWVYGGSASSGEVGVLTDDPNAKTYFCGQATDGNKKGGYVFTTPEGSKNLLEGLDKKNQQGRPKTKPHRQQ